MSLHSQLVDQVHYVKIMIALVVNVALSRASDIHDRWSHCGWNMYAIHS